MSQITNGVRAVLSSPFMYTAFQTLMGAKKSRQGLVSNHIKPTVGIKVLDIGCGPADILECLPNVKYWGFDISEAYITRAQQQFANRGNFQCKQLGIADLETLPKFDVVLALGLLHHLDDEMAVDVMKLAWHALRPGGRLVSVDPCIDPSQNLIAKFLVSKDRGQNVRDEYGYRSLGSDIFPTRNVQVKHQAWIPYTHCFMECTKT